MTTTDTQRLIADLVNLAQAMPPTLADDLREAVLSVTTRVETMVNQHRHPPFPARWVDDLDDTVRRLTARIHAQRVDG